MIKLIRSPGNWRWYRRLRGGVWRLCVGWYQGQPIALWTRNEEPPPLVAVFQHEDHRRACPE